MTTEVDYIDPAEAPSVGRGARPIWVPIIVNCPPGKVGRIKLNGRARESIRNSLANAARMLRRPVKTWTDAEYVYFMHRDDQP